MISLSPQAKAFLHVQLVTYVNNTATFLPSNIPQEIGKHQWNKPCVHLTCSIGTRKKYLGGRTGHNTHTFHHSRPLPPLYHRFSSPSYLLRALQSHLGCSAGDHSVARATRGVIRSGSALFARGRGAEKRPTRVLLCCCRRCWRSDRKPRASAALEQQFEGDEER